MNKKASKSQGAQRGNKNASKAMKDKANNQICLRVSDDMNDWIAAQAELKGMSKSKVIIQAVMDSMKEVNTESIERAELIQWVEQEKLSDAHNEDLPLQYKEACSDVWTDVLKKLA
ncbi:MAG: hypothetical protein HRT88_22605 [Lentisphaeraceae bacterium]|nr:hypothetical protein [Lentisphaeraceae bacterium]